MATFAKYLTLGGTLGLLALAASAKEWWDYPEEIKVLDVEGNSLKIIVNKSSRLPETFVPENLEIIAPDIIRTKKETKVRRELLNPLQELRLAAEKDGIDLVVLSGYRSYSRQEEVHKFWIERENGDRAAAEKYSARPGHSEHQLGTVVDFSTKEISDAIGDRFHPTQAAKWLRKNAGKYGFRISYPKGKEAQTGYQWESWHWRWWPEAK